MLRFIHISDTHINPDPDYGKAYNRPSPLEAARMLVEQINGLPFAPDFVLHTGDVAYDPDPDAYPICREVLGQIKFPVYYLAGNHDDPAALQRIVMGRERIQTALHYEFEASGVQIVAVDSNGPALQPAGYMTDEQLDFLHQRCRPDDPRPLVIAVHHNPLPVGIPWLDNFMGIQNGNAFHAAILPARERIRGVFFGHVHQNLDIQRDGILYCSTLSSWYQIYAWPGQTDVLPEAGAEPGFSVVSITPAQTFVRRHRYAPLDHKNPY